MKIIHSEPYWYQLEICRLFVTDFDQQNYWKTEAELPANTHTVIQIYIALLTAHKQENITVTRALAERNICQRQIVVIEQIPSAVAQPLL